MIVLARPRRGGKTHAMLEFLRDNPDGTIVTFTEVEAQRLRQLATDRGIFALPDQFVSIESVKTGALLGRQSFGVYVDNADMLLERLIGQQVHAISVTGVAL